MSAPNKQVFEYPLVILAREVLTLGQFSRSVYQMQLLKFANDKCENECMITTEKPLLWCLYCWRMLYNIVVIPVAIKVPV